jgi:acetyl-CoA carboxylase biotin carboxyl carrier protein
MQAGPAAPAPSEQTIAAPAAPVSSTPVPDDKTVYVKSPIVGTYYECASPGSPPFVKAGDRVSAGQVLCIIESMKLMNEIESDVSGIVIDKLIENGRPVEYGESLFAIQPA